MDSLPPGIAYLIRSSPQLLPPPALAYALVRLASSYYDLVIPGWVLALAMFLSLPLALTISITWADFLVWQDARRMGAELPPTVKDSLPGGMSRVLQAAKTFKTGYPGQLLSNLLFCREIGGYTFNGRTMFQNRIVTCEPEYIKAILSSQFDEFEKGPEIRYLFQPLLGTGVFAADGGLWKYHRSMTRPFFSRDRISHFDIFDRHAEDAINKLKSRLGEGHPVDFQDLVARFTLDSATEFLFGNDVQSLSEELPYPHYISSPFPSTVSSEKSFAEQVDHPASRFVAAFSKAQFITVFRMRFGMHWPLGEFWHDKIKEPMKIVNGFIDPIVAEAIRKKREVAQARIVKDRDDETLLENLVNSTEDPIALRDEIMSLLVAGRDTTASTLTFVVYMLAEHPEVLRRLRQEVLEKLGNQKRPTYDDIKEMKYLKAVINETLRLYPVVPFNVRMSKKATVWPNKIPGGKPIYIPANTRTPYSVFVMHRRKDLWGPDALEFDPDRFLDQRLHKYLTPNPFIFLPFNAGPRICLGQQFAYNEASFFLVRLLQNFSDISLVSDAQPPESNPPVAWAEDKEGRKGKEKIRPRSHLTLYADGGLWITLKEAKLGETVV
ncbi:cytochrome P450 [Gymnopilus junonius]|uniref:Cytochrome P450 n=1 Tax=Gymnopilus junonius TaxID=109634 RepID=A0A9P5NTH1_GYMJU|nr:cytochrome P450 [Gymnopilus junonius]